MHYNSRRLPATTCISKGEHFMKPHLALARAIAIAFLALLALPAFADSAIVDCSGATPGAFITIHAALATLPAAGPNIITVSGTCAENVVMFGRTDLTIIGSPSATVVPGNPNGRLLVIFSSQRI